MIAVGAISSYDDVNTIILAGRADLCALARPHLWDPHWTLHAAADQGVDDRLDPAVPLRLARAEHGQGRAPDAAATLRRGARVRTVVVTGGKRGIGAAISARTSQGWATSSRSPAPTSTSPTRPRSRACSARSAPSTCWSTTPACPRRAPLEAHDAGRSGSASIAVNATGAFLCTRAVLEGMRERDSGRIVTVASLAGHVGVALHVRLHGVQARGARADARGRGRGRRHRRDRQLGLPRLRAQRHDRRRPSPTSSSAPARTARRRWPRWRRSGG